jgi:hypothetical protein
MKLHTIIATVLIAFSAYS